MPYIQSVLPGLYNFFIKGGDHALQVQVIFAVNKHMYNVTRVKQYVMHYHIQYVLLLCDLFHYYKSHGGNRSRVKCTSLSHFLLVTSILFWTTLNIDPLDITVFK